MLPAPWEGDPQPVSPEHSAHPVLTILVIVGALALVVYGLITLVGYLVVAK